MSNQGWIAVDLDGTFAFYDRWRGHKHIGPVIQPMLERVKKWLAEGREVRIFTARVSGDDPKKIKEIVYAIHAWLKELGLPALRVTCVKDYQMVEQWDDRAVQVIPNTGRTIADELDAVKAAHAGKVAKP